ncbi:hypothetical protein ACJMK2_023028 [Sinanodonta woodiana]|uniref:Secreted protein n=1 Tax=Sinanodonta woodiana TaxID=1069815 RepID=A0ABD3T2V9_SINWO
MKTVCLFLVFLAVCTYKSNALAGFDAGDLMMYQMMSGMFGGQRGPPPQAPVGANTDFGGQGQPQQMRSGGDLGLGNLLQMRMLLSMMN